MAGIDREMLQKLVDDAKKASKHAYCPYSDFPVGAAILTTQGCVFTGCNVENASLGLTICAERNAIFHMVAEGQQQIVAVAVYTPTPSPSAPCGACRQVINEFGPEAQIISICDGPDILQVPLTKLLPHVFGPTDME